MPGCVWCDLRSLDRTTIIATTLSPITTIEPITMPAIAPTEGDVLLLGGKGETMVVGGGLTVARFEEATWLTVSGVLLGIGPFAGFVSSAYSIHDGFRVE